MRRRDRLIAIARIAGRSIEAGAAALGLSLLVMSDDLAPQVAALFVLVLAALGSLAAREQRWSTVTCFVLFATLIALARREVGTAAAIAVSLAVGISAWARLRFRDVRAGLAVFGAFVGLSAGASLRLVLAFWLFGWMAALLALWRDRRSALKTESRELRALKSES